MAKMKPKTLAAIGRWAVLLPPTIAMLGSGLNKFMDPAKWRADFAGWGYPEWMVPLIGGAEVVAAVLTVIAATRFYGGALIVAIMLGAAVTHITAGEYMNVLVNVVLGFLAGVTAWWARPAFVEQMLHRGE